MELLKKILLFAMMLCLPISNSMAQETENVSTFSLKDFINPASLIQKWRDAARNDDAVSSFLKSKVSTQFQAKIDAYDGKAVSKELLENLVKEFNILLEIPLYDKKVFANVTLSEKTNNLLKKSQELPVLNRSLLEDAYPDEIMRKKDDTFELEETVVTAARIPEDKNKTSRSVAIVTEEEMVRRRSSSSTSAEFLKDEPGVLVQQTGRKGGAPIVRGMIGKYILPMVDGVRLTDGTIFSGPNSFFNNVDSMSVERMEIVYGPSSVLYGSDAMGGTINMITRRFDTFPDEFEIHARGIFQYSSINAGHSERLEIYGGAKPFNFTLGGTFRNAEDSEGGEDVGQLENTSWREGNFDVRVGYQLAPNHTINLSYKQTNRYDEYRFDKPYKTPHLNEWWEAHSSLYQTSSGLRTNMWKTPKSKTYLASAEYDGKNLTPFWDDTLVKFYWRREEGKSIRRSEQTKTYREDYEVSERDVYGLSTQFTTSVDKNNRLVYGVDFRVDSVPASDAWRDTIQKSDGTTTTTDQIPSSPKARYLDTGVYIYDEVRYLYPLTLSAGLRFNATGIISDPTEKTTPEGLTPDDLDIDTYFYAVTWSIGANYEVIDGLNFITNVGTGFKSPSISDVLSTGAFTYGVNVPSVDLDPEQSLTFDIGVKVKFPKIRGSATGYYTMLRDIIDSRPGTFNGKDYVDLNGNGSKDSGEDVYVKENVGKGYIYGVTANVEYDFLSLDGAGTFSILSDICYTLGQETDSHEPMRFIPPLFGSYGIRWKNDYCWAEFIGHWAASKHEDRFSSSDLKDTAQFPGEVGKLPGYNIMSLRTGLTLELLPKSTFTFTFSIENILNADYQSFASRLPGEGRSFNLSVEIEY